MFGFGPFRNRRFVDRQLQGRLISRVGLYWLLYHVLLWHALLVYRYIQFRMMRGAGSMQGSFGEHFGQLAGDYFPVLLCGLLTLPVVLIDMLRVSHRIAGPLVRLGEALRDLREGRTVDRLALRREDLLGGFQQEFNAYLAWRRQNTATPVAEAGHPSFLSGSEAAIAAQIRERRTSASEIPGVVGALDDSALSPGRPVCST
jgi:hypothetical protein